MNEHFLTYEQSAAVKELGFNEPCFGYYTHNEKLCRYGVDETNVEFLFCTHKDIYKTYSLAPLKSQFFKWAREKYGIKRQQVSYDDDYDNYWYEKWFDTYEEAEDACINGIIELIKQKI